MQKAKETVREPWPWPRIYRLLAEHLGPDQPTYGLFSEREIALAAGTAPRRDLPTVPELARLYLTEVRRIQPVGPYHIVGYSFGGRIAFEMAQQLHAAGEVVALLAIIDTLMPGAIRRRPLHWVLWHLTNFLRHGPRHVIARARDRWGRFPAVPMDGGPEATETMRVREDIFRRRVRHRYQPRPYSGPIVLVRAMGKVYSRSIRVEPLLGWAPLARGTLDVHDLPGTHGGILSVNAELVAKVLQPHVLARQEVGPSSHPR